MSVQEREREEEEHMASDVVYFLVIRARQLSMPHPADHQSLKTFVQVSLSRCSSQSSIASVRSLCLITTNAHRKSFTERIHLSTTNNSPCKKTPGKTLIAPLLLFFFSSPLTDSHFSSPSKRLTISVYHHSSSSQ